MGPVSVVPPNPTSAMYEVPSIAMRETLERYGVEVPIAIVPTGIRLPEFVGGDGARFRARHGIQPGRPVALFVGRVAFEKNIEFLVRMLAHASCKVVLGVIHHVQRCSIRINSILGAVMSRSKTM